jgi:hypothetical protein
LAGRLTSRKICVKIQVWKDHRKRGTKLERNNTSLSITVGARTNSTYMGDSTVIDLSISTHLRGENGGILSDFSQHLTLQEAKELVAQLNLTIAEIELELVNEQ